MTRARVAVLAVVASLLVVRGPVDAPTASDVSSATPAARLRTDDVANIIGAANPSLSGHELERIGSAVTRYSAKYQLEPALVTAVLLVESGARPWARSPKGAMGLMQVMPAMREPLALAGNSATIESNIEAGCIILARNIRQFGEANGVSAYFWGPDIRGDAYLQRVRAARDQVRRLLGSRV
jgi:soluble lytic murein transglycosylase-like protein